MTNPSEGNDSSADGKDDRDGGMAAFIAAAILVVIVLAAVNTQSIMHGIRTALF
jgi:hypothetical protein